jgi:hypothetical protein
MSIEQSILEKLRTLRPEKQREVLDFIEFLQRRSLAKPLYRSLRGLWADLEVRISGEHIAEAQWEM